MSEETKQKIMDGARKSLIKEGHRRSTIKVIADYAGVNHGLVHHYFGSKEELMVALIQHHSQQVLPVLFRELSGLVRGASAGAPPKRPGKDESETTGSIHGCRNG